MNNRNGEIKMLQDRQRMVVEVTETITYQIPLDVRRPGDDDSIMSAWLVKPEEETKEYRTGTKTDFRVVETEADQTSTLENLAEHLEEVIEVLRQVVSEQKAWQKG